MLFPILQFSELLIDSDGPLTAADVFRGGDGTFIERSRLDEVFTFSGTKRAVQLDLPSRGVVNARAYARAEAARDGSRGPFNFLTNGCTSYARDFMRAAGLQPPAWTLTATGLDFWMRTLGARGL